MRPIARPAFAPPLIPSEAELELVLEEDVGVELWAVAETVAEVIPVAARIAADESKVDSGADEIAVGIFEVAVESVVACLWAEDEAVE